LAEADVQFHFHEALDSTNEEAKRLAKTNAKTPTVIVAETQSLGRGQQGRKWVSDNTGGLYYSLLLKPEQFDFEAIPEYVVVIGKLILKIIKKLTSIEGVLEWPNDLIIQDKKCGGILVETVGATSTQNPRYVIIGIGLNINQEKFPKEISAIATSLYLASGKTYNKRMFIDSLTKELVHVFARH